MPRGDVVQRGLRRARRLLISFVSSTSFHMTDSTLLRSGTELGDAKDHGDCQVARHIMSRKFLHIIPSSIVPVATLLRIDLF